MLFKEDKVRLQHMNDAAREVDLNILWGTVTEDLPPLISALEEILSRKHS